ncbi:MAG: AP protein [Verrucomicrobiae bacterium]|nr:AP protein [Verrucomicrobiae bacterium]
MKSIATALLAAVGLAAFIAPSAHGADRATRHVFLISTDGLRWEEVFRGAEEILISREYGNVGNTNALRELYWRPTPEARRQALLPFLWSTVATQGQLWGNRDLRSDVRVSNTRLFSYPGYNELLTGYADPRIDSNDKTLNVNTNVFEWLNTLPAYRDRVAAAINWDVLPWILNAPRAGFPVWSGFDVPPGTRRMDVPDALTEMVEYGRTIWSGVLLDTFVGYAARHAVRSLQPRAMYISLGETDDWAHDGSYERYLRAAHEFDRFLASLWTLVQSMPDYRDRTTFLITVDHGRGPAPLAWKDHGRAIAASAYMWFAVLGPDTAPLGERSNTLLVTQAQMASTVAAFLGEDFHAFFPNAAQPVREILARP